MLREGSTYSQPAKTPNTRSDSLAQGICEQNIRCSVGETHFRKCELQKKMYLYFKFLNIMNENADKR